MNDHNLAHNLDMKYVESLEKEFAREWKIWEAMEELKRQQPALPEDLEHPEKLIAETSESIEEFVRCYGEHLAFEVRLKPGEISQAEVPLLEAVAEACGRLTGLFRRMQAAGLESEKLGAQLRQGLKQAQLACEGGQRGKVS